MSTPAAQVSTRKLVSLISLAFLVALTFVSFSMQQNSFREQFLSMVSLDKTTTEVLLPDWRMTVDCSAYSRDCVLRKLNQNQYAKYPFRLDEKYQDRYEWQEALPMGWKRSLAENVPLNVAAVGAPKEMNPSIQTCVNAAQQKSVDQQLDHLLETLERNEVDMVSFTISDYKYAQDMINDVFEMAHSIVGFRNAFFMVAMDTPTMELACQYSLPFLAWPKQKKSQQDDQLKSTVASSKFDISYLLAKRRQSFFFFEMDVWFVKSPIPVIREQTDDILFSGHQNNPQAANIGVYSVAANEASEEYLRICIEILEQSPDTHDQAIMQQVYDFLDKLKAGRPFRFNAGAFKEPYPKFPTFQHPAKHGRFVPFQIVADERPVPSEGTLAIHPLCGAPLRNPHGKKMIAKELGAWYGSGNYYYGKQNRYLWLDGHAWNGFSTAMSWPGFNPHESYHEIELLYWSIAATVALARRTKRIWVMPKILNDAGIHFLWTFLDMSSIEALQVDIRETNFPVNPKAWHSPSVSFGPVARTAVGADGKIFAQLTADASTETILAWNSSAYNRENNAEASPFDAWFAIHTAIHQLVDAQVLLAGLPASKSEVHKLREKVRSNVKLSMAENEIADVWRKLRWCVFDIAAGSLEKIVGRTPADWDCYLRGKPAPGASVNH